MSDPITREETFLAAAAGDSVTLPKPITRVEQYLKRIAERTGTGGGSPDSPQNVTIDKTLTIEGAAADAKAVGDALASYINDVAALVGGNA